MATPNELGAKILKAELMGNDELVKSLKEQLEAVRKNVTSSEQQKKTNTDSADKPYKSLESSSSNRKQSIKSHANGSSSIKSVDMEQAKILKRNFQGREYDDYSTGYESVDNSTKKMKRKHAQKMERSGHYAQSSLSSSELRVTSTSAAEEVVGSKKEYETSEYSYENVKQHLVISAGKFSYLGLPSHRSLCENQCFIAPMSQHQRSSVTCDEEVWSEIRSFCKTLVQMFDTQAMDCVFTEHFTNGRTTKASHMLIECVPLARSVSNMAPIYFKKALIECESEWSTNKKIVSLPDSNSIRKSLPTKMPYFSVQFGDAKQPSRQTGYAHLIENVEEFPDHFGKEVIGGILDINPFEWRKRTREECFSVQSKKAIDFTKLWKPFEFNTQSK